MGALVWFFFTLASLGAFHVSQLSMGLLLHLARCLGLSRDLRRRYGAWAVVTGPTSGIGRSMSLELARCGLNLMLVGRDPAKLREISETISRTHGVQTMTVLFDFSLVSTPQGQEAMARLQWAVEGLDVGVLVNNAGVAKPGAVYLHEVNLDDAWARMIRVNIMALAEVTAAVLPGMVERWRSAVVNIGSGSASALPSFPLYSVYAATKRYVAVFSRSLSAEYGSKGIDVQCQVPFLVDTNMVSSAIKGSFIRQFVVSPDAYARQAVRWIGHGALCVPSVAHRLQWCYAGLLPDHVHDADRLQRHQQQRAMFRRLKPWRNTLGNSAGDAPVAPSE